MHPAQGCLQVDWGFNPLAESQIPYPLQFNIDRGLAKYSQLKCFGFKM